MTKPSVQYRWLFDPADSWRDCSRADAAKLLCAFRKRGRAYFLRNGSIRCVTGLNSWVFRKANQPT